MYPCSYEHWVKVDKFLALRSGKKRLTLATQCILLEVKLSKVGNTKMSSFESYFLIFIEYNKKCFGNPTLRRSHMSQVAPSKSASMILNKSHHSCKRNL